MASRMSGRRRPTFIQTLSWFNIATMFCDQRDIPAMRTFSNFISLLCYNTLRIIFFSQINISVTLSNPKKNENVLIVRAHFRNFWLSKAFFSRIWHAVVLAQFGNADSKSAPCQAIFCVFPTQNSKTKWPPNLVKMSQLYITAWITMNIKTSVRCIKTHLSNILKVP